MAEAEDEDMASDSEELGADDFEEEEGDEEEEDDVGGAQGVPDRFVLLFIKKIGQFK